MKRERSRLPIPSCFIATGQTSVGLIQLGSGSRHQLARLTRVSGASRGYYRGDRETDGIELSC